MQTLWLVRHAHRLDFIKPEWFDTAIYPYDPPLSAEGFTQAISLATEFDEFKPKVERIFTSPFLRTIQTADPLARLLHSPIQLEWGLCEWLCEDWTVGMPETTPINELMRCYPNIVASYQSQVIPCYPETIVELDARIAMVADKLIQCNDRQVLAIAHKGSVLGIVAALTGDRDWKTYDLPCGGVIKLVCNEDGRWLSSIIDR
jgi:broad specificity phosphatase PhoE